MKCPNCKAVMEETYMRVGANHRIEEQHWQCPKCKTRMQECDLGANRRHVDSTAVREAK